MHDLRYAIRQLAKTPGFTAVAVLSLALGIGANTAVFSVFNAMLLRTLPVKNPDELVVFNWVSEQNVQPQGVSGWQRRDSVTGGFTSTSFSLHTFEQFRTHNETLADVFAFAPLRRVNVNVDGHAEIVAHAQLASGTYHLGLGVSPAAGRLFTPADDDPSADAVAVISHSYWQRRFGADPAAIGKTITANGVPVTIIGVTAPGFQGAMQVGEVVDLTVPLALQQRLIREDENARDPTHWWVRIMGRLKPGNTREQACASLQGIFHETAKGALYIPTAPGMSAPQPADIPLPQLRAEPGGQGLYEARQEHKQALRLLIALVTLVLLVACANVTHLLLARGASRRREIAVRLALGANRARIVGQLLTESLLLAFLGTMAGIVVALWGTPALLALQPFGSGVVELDASIDWRVLGFASCLTLLSGVTFGLAPALRATRVDLNAEFQGGTRALGRGPRSRLAQSLMVIQVALSIVLLVGAGLFVRTLRNLQHVELGFRRERLLLFSVDATANGTTGAEAAPLYDRMLKRIAGVPGVARAGFARVAPVSWDNWHMPIHVPGHVAPTPESVRTNAIDANYLATLEIPLLFGRNFTAGDGASASKVALVNQAFAKRYFGDENVVGRRIYLGGRQPQNEMEIVGVIGNTHYSEVRSSPPPIVYQPYWQLGAPTAGAANFAVRFSGDAAAIISVLRAAIREIDPSFPLFNVRTQEEQIDRLLMKERLFAQLCTVLGLLALVLATIGLYGLMSYAVTRRTGEIGLRMALGAQPRRVIGMVVGESFQLVALGVVIGLAAAYAASRWISSMLFGVSAADPLTYGGVALLLIATGCLAGLLPAHRAARVDPVVALRAE